MSADNIAYCPKCVEEAKVIGETAETTLREYYDVGILDGKFIVEYACKCNACGFKYEFNLEQEIKNP